MNDIRTGLGYDRHQFETPGSGPLAIGCVKVDFDRRLDGHSDGDVVAHAIADALLSACGFGDLGTSFPAGSPATVGIAGSAILHRTADWVVAAGWRIGNVDCTVVCDNPALGTHVPAMKKAVGFALGLSQDRVCIKPRHAEGLGFAGRGEGVEAMAVVLVFHD